MHLRFIIKYAILLTSGATLTLAHGYFMVMIMKTQLIPLILIPISLVIYMASTNGVFSAPFDSRILYRIYIYMATGFMDSMYNRNYIHLCGV